MPTPEQHALLSASSSSRWLHCTPAPLLESTLPETTSEYAEEGRVAHAVAELYVRRKFSPSMTTRKYNAELKRIQGEPSYDAEMLKHAEDYADKVSEEALTYAEAPLVLTEQVVNYSAYAPEGFGTADCVMVGGDCISVIDFKYGQGVPVDAVGNTQMQLYALGALGMPLMMFYPGINRIRMQIFQPRINNNSVWEITRAELENWGEQTVKPAAKLAYEGNGEYRPGEWCRFCRAKATCRARAYDYLAIEAFAQRAPGEEQFPTLTNDEVGAVLKRAEALVDWYNALKGYAQELILAGEAIPGWKVVEGRSLRVWADQDKAIELLLESGYPRELIYDTVPKSLSQLEKAIGKATFTELVGGQIVKPAGKPAIVEESDKRPPFNPAQAAFGAAT